MKLFLFSWMIFCVFSLQRRHPTVTAVDNDYDPSLNRLSDFQEKLVNELGYQISRVLKAVNIPEVFLDDEDYPTVQNLTSTVDDDSLNGNLFMYNVMIDGLSENEDDIDVDVVRDKFEIRMKVKLKQLKIHGEYAFETSEDGAEKKGTFSVTLANVLLQGVAVLLADPYGNMVVTKVEPTILSEESHVTMKPKIIQSGPIFESAMNHLRSNVYKRFARIATLEVLMHYPKIIARTEVTKANWSIFEAQRFVSQRYVPYRFKKLSMNDSPSSWQLGPFQLHGLSNFHLDEVNMITTNNSVNIMVRILSESLWARFPFTFQKKFVGEYTVTKMDFIGKIKLMADNSQPCPLMDGLGLEMSGCKIRLNDKASGATVHLNELGFDAEDLFCLLIRNEISTQNIIRTIQSEIFNRVDLGLLKDKISSVMYEDRLFSSSY